MSKCDLIRDLLPLYVDGAASKESARAVEEHVATCYECRRALQDMRAPNPLPAPVVEDVNFAAALGQLRKMRAKRRAKYICWASWWRRYCLHWGWCSFLHGGTAPTHQAPGGLRGFSGGAEGRYPGGAGTGGRCRDGSFYAPKPIEWYSYSFSMTPALDGNYYDQIYFSALSRQPQETADKADSLYRYFITYQEGWQEMEIYKGSERDRQLLYQPGDTLPTACEELKQTLAEEDMFSAEMQAALAHQVALNRGEAQPAATP